MATITDRNAEAIGVVEAKVVQNSQDRKLWLFDAGLRKLNFWMLILFTSSYALGFDSSLFAGLSTIPVWFTDMNNPEGEILGAVGVSGLIGFISGPLLASYFNDRYGRRPSMIVSAIISVIFGVITSVKISDPKGQQLLFILSRVCLSTGFGWAMVTAPTLMSELAHPDHRAVVTCLYLAG